MMYFTFAAEYVDMVKAGIIDPVKVIRTSLVDAARYFLAFFLLYSFIDHQYKDYHSCLQFSFVSDSKVLIFLDNPHYSLI